MNNPNASVLVIDDEPQIRRFLRAGFEIEGYAVHEAESANEGLRNATVRPPDLIILDLGLPDMDGAEVVERVRSWSKVPLIVLSVRSHENEKVRLLELGADDYMVKPFGMAELLARARSAIRRHNRTDEGASVVKSGPLTIDLSTRIVMLDDRKIGLTPKEYRLLQMLAQNAGRVVTHQQLIRGIWGANETTNPQYLRIFMRKLRRKIEATPNRPRIILTELGVGYRLAQPASAEMPVAN
jgi:two-component system, OmpR family, KDP operon response regulator KdpE